MHEAVKTKLNRGHQNGRACEWKRLWKFWFQSPKLQSWQPLLSCHRASEVPFWDSPPLTASVSCWDQSCYAHWGFNIPGHSQGIPVQDASMSADAWWHGIKNLSWGFLVTLASWLQADKQRAAFAIPPSKNLPLVKSEDLGILMPKVSFTPHLQFSDL